MFWGELHLGMVGKRRREGTPFYRREKRKRVAPAFQVEEKEKRKKRVIAVFVERCPSQVER